MPIPVWAVGQVLAASDVNNWFVPLAAYKAASTGRTSTTLTIDTDLQVTLAANAVWSVTAAVNYQNTGGTGAFQWNFQVPSGAAGAYSAAYVQPGPVNGTWGNNWGVTVTAAASDNLSHGIPITGTVWTGGTGGTFGLVWSVQAASGTMTVGAGSMITARRIG